MLLVAFAAGALAAGILVWQKYFLLDLTSTWKLESIVLLFFAGLEEVLKMIFLLLAGKIIKARFTQIIDGAVYGVMAGLGFACIENIIYFQSLWVGSWNAAFIEVVSFRSLGSMLLHALTTGIFGYFWGYAIFSKKIAPKDSAPLIAFFKNFFKSFSFHIFREHILQNRESDHGHEKIEVVQEGVRAAIIIHFVFNILLEYTGVSQTPLILIVFILIAVFSWFSKQFLRKRNIQIFKAL